ncbi:MAG: hypothetical protein LBN00_03840 [Oscillospiraceae bacterium]|jgi:rubrerythrin|nr:hypothetical protein [Oscillospiraceae bacterium]
MNKREVAIEILANMEDEADAQRGYQKLLTLEGLTAGDRKQIAEIISDEKNHLIILQAMLRDYDGDISPADDGLKQAISELD